MSKRDFREPAPRVASPNMNTQDVWADAARADAVKDSLSKDEATRAAHRPVQGDTSKQRMKSRALMSYICRGRQRTSLELEECIYQG